jgi:hypothetical protein
VQHEVVEVDELALAPQGGSGIEEVGAVDPAVADRAFGEPFVEPGGGATSPLPMSLRLGGRPAADTINSRRSFAGGI